MAVTDGGSSVLLRYRVRTICWPPLDSLTPRKGKSGCQLDGNRLVLSLAGAAEPSPSEAADQANSDEDPCARLGNRPKLRGRNVVAQGPATRKPVLVVEAPMNSAIQAAV